MDNAFRNRPIRVLIADDHAVLRDGLKATLATVPDIDVVAEAADGREAVNRALALSLDVVLMDISMPMMNGIDAVRELRRLHVSARVVMLSMHSTSDFITSAFAAGADGYVIKSAAATEVVSAIRIAHQGRQFVSEALSDVALDPAVIWRHSDPADRLSARERQVLQLVAEGHSSSAIAAAVHLSPKSVDTYRSRLMRKLGAKNVVGLVKAAIRQRLVTVD